MLEEVVHISPIHYSHLRRRLFYLFMLES